MSEGRVAAIVIPIDERCDSVADALASGLGEAPAAALDRWRERPGSPPAVAPEPEPQPIAPTPPEPDRTRARRAWGGSVGVAAGVHLRLPGVAANIRADVAAVHPSGLFLGAVGVLAPSRAERLEVVDAAALGAIGWRAVLSDRIVLRPSVGVGLSSQAVAHHLDLAIRAPVEVELRLAARTFLSFALAGSFATRRVEHRLDDRLIWSRGVVGLEALVGLRFDWANAARVLGGARG